MRRTLLRATLLCAIVTTVVGCRGCICSNVFHAFTDKPDEAKVREEVGKRLPTAREVASELCGISTKGLQDATVKVVSETALGTRVHVEGAPIADAADEPDDAGEGDDDASPKVKKPLVCAGVLLLVFVPILDGDGKAKGWELTTMSVAGIETDGVKYDESKHQSHHHHHH